MRVWSWFTSFMNISIYTVCTSTEHHCVKSIRIRSFSSPCLLAFGLNRERYGVCIRIRPECRSEKLQIRRLFTKCMSYRMYLIIWLANIKYAISLQKKMNIKCKICFFSYFWNQRSLSKRLSFILMISETKNRRQKALTGLRESITKLNLTDCRSNKVDNILFKVSFLPSHDNPKTTFSSLYFF